MDILDFNINCHVSLRPRYSDINQTSEAYISPSTNAWTPIIMANITSFPNYGNMMESDMNRHLTPSKNIYIPSAEYNTYCPSDGQFDMSAPDHWSTYNYSIHPYSYHGYGQYDTMDASYVVSSQQIYPTSWHVPYNTSETGYSNHYSQMYHPTAFKDSPLQTSRTITEENRNNKYSYSDAKYFNMDRVCASQRRSAAESNTFNHDDKSFHCDKKTFDLNMKASSVIQRNPAYTSSVSDEYGADTTASVSPNTGNNNYYHADTVPCSITALHHVSEEDRDSTDKCSKTSNIQLSNHVRKQERKMKKLLHELLKTDSHKASQLLETYQFHYSMIERQFIDNTPCDGNLHHTFKSPNADIDFQVLQLVRQVQHQLGLLGFHQHEYNGNSRKNSFANELRKTRLLPKRAVKILEAWFDDNLSNPYPSRDQTLRLAMDCGLSIEQVRKWFANKRNRSRNNKLYK